MARLGCSLGLVAIAGCGFELTLGRPPDGSASTDDGGTDDGLVVPDGGRPDAPDAPLPMLVDRGLVARYFIAESAVGQPVASLVDSAAMPLALPISYGQMAFSETNGHRGLTWGTSQGSGKIELALGMSKLRTRLTSTPTITIEVVVRIANAGASGSESQITGMRGSNPDFMLTAVGATDLRFFKPFGTEGATWTNVNEQQRMVLHLVFNTSRQNANERIELFKNGVNVIKATGSAPVMSSLVGLGASDVLVIGNRQQQDRSISGTIFYVAYYDVALTVPEIAANAQRLLATDDP